MGNLYSAFCMYFISFIFVIGIGSGFVCFSNSKEFKKNFCVFTVILGLPIYFVVLYIPIFLLKSMYKSNNLISILILFIICILAYLFLRVGTKIINSLKLKKENEQDSIYIRDIEVEYSPAVLSYLENQKIEPQKDLVASILNLCSKKLLNITKKEDNTYKLECIQNINSETLKSDEKYLYDAISEKRYIDVNKWVACVKEEYKKYKFSKQNPSVIWIFLFFVYAFLLISLSLKGSNQVTDVMLYPAITVFLTAVEIAMLEPVIMAVLKHVKKGEVFKDIYSSMGALEMTRWEKYKKFLKDYTLIKDRKLDSIIVLEKHLAYAMVLKENKSYEDSIIEELKIKYSINFNEIKEAILKKDW